MKKNLYAILLLSAFTLASCGKSEAPAESSKPETTAASSTAASTSAPAAEKTSPVTTATEPAPISDLPDGAVLKPLETVEVYEDMPLSKLINEKNVELRDPDMLADTSETGAKSVKVAFTYEGVLYETDLKYIVEDTTPPLKLNGGWNPYVRVGEAFDVDNIIGYADNYDRHPQAVYSGEVDTSEVGSYPISVTVSDSSGNETSWDMTVLVVNEIPKPEDNNDRVDFADFMDYYDFYDDVSFGIDVSVWQSDVDFEAVRDAGCEFVLMRMGYYYGSDVVMDDYYKQNMANATAAGLDVGVYFYTADNTEEGARERARWIVEQLDGRKLDYPIAFDWEEWATFQEYGMNLHDLNSVFEAFADEVGKSGYSAMLYSSKNFLENVWKNYGDHPVWLAHYTDETDYEGDFALWQASAYGRIPGIGGDVDMNIRFNYEPLD